MGEGGDCFAEYFFAVGSSQKREDQNQNTPQKIKPCHIADGIPQIAVIEQKCRLARQQHKARRDIVTTLPELKYDILF